MSVSKTKRSNGFKKPAGKSSPAKDDAPPGDGEGAKGEDPSGAAEGEDGTQKKAGRRNTPAVRKSGKENKSAATVVVPLTQRQKETLEHLASSKGVSMAEVMRTALDEYAEHNMMKALEEQARKAQQLLDRYHGGGA